MMLRMVTASVIGCASGLALPNVAADCAGSGAVGRLSWTGRLGGEEVGGKTNDGRRFSLWPEPILRSIGS